MTFYRLYSIDADGHISAPAVILEFDLEAAAIEAAKTYVNGRGVELWDGARQLAKFSPE